MAELVNRGPLTREELSNLFWQSDAPEGLAKFATISRVNFIRSLPPITIAEEPLPPGELCTMTILSEAIDFHLEGQPFGGHLYLAVLCGQHVIVPPFPIEQRENLPALRPT